MANEPACNANANGLRTGCGSHRVHVGDAGVTFLSLPGKPLLHGMIAARVAAIPVGCRGGGCGICRIRVVSGNYSAQAMSRTRISEADEASGIVLACRIVPQGDMEIDVLPLETWRGKTTNGTCIRAGNPGEK